MKIVREFYLECILILLLLITIQQCIGFPERTIFSDGEGYYEYLPATFIHHDINRRNKNVTEYPGQYERINNLGNYIDYEAYKVNKYQVGTAVLQTPFFLYAYSTTQLNNTREDGYQQSFHNAMRVSAFFYLFLGLYFFKKFLELYEIKKPLILLSQFLLIFSTSIINYINVEAAFSHVYSLFAVTVFLYLVKSFYIQKRTCDLLLAAACFGLILLIRQVNGLILFSLPFLAGSWANFKDTTIALVRKPLLLVYAVLIIFAVFFIQCYYWYLQTGAFFIYSYGEEAFNFLTPRFIKILFSYRKGLFVYTPVLFICLAGVFYFLKEKKQYLFFTWLFFFTIITFVFSSWWSWVYGCSYGMRVYIEFYPFFLLPFVLMLQKVSLPVKITMITLALITVPINIIQTYQYKNYILHWIDMNKEDYWKIFLKTDKRYEGILFQNKIDTSYAVVKEIRIPDQQMQAYSSGEFYRISSTEIPDFDKTAYIQVMIDNAYQEADSSSVILTINDTLEKKNYFWVQKNLIHFAKGKFNTQQTGYYNFETEAMELPRKPLMIGLEMRTSDRPVKLKNIRILFYRKIKD
ncbi:MAG: hypothetical protein ACTHJT_11985 [Cytophaga sp.]|uniref:hypothetical protein n=1 Tax=Cytophaga sp. TaxID=29535 RepID=UPI003F8028CA